MAKKARRKPVQKAPDNSLARTRRETKIRLQREVRLEKQIAVLSRTLERLIGRRRADMRQLANFLIDHYDGEILKTRQALDEQDRMALAGR